MTNVETRNFASLFRVFDINLLIHLSPLPCLMKHLCDALVLPLPKLLRAIALVAMRLR